MSIYDVREEFPITITIATDDSVSNAVDMGGYVLVGIYTPSGLTGANLSFRTNGQLSESIANYKPIMKDTGTAYSVTMTTNDYISVDPIKFLGVRNIRIESDGNEAANRTFTLVGALV